MIDQTFFKPSEFCIDANEPISVDVADKINNIIFILNPIRRMICVPIIVSKKSGYRSYDWEKKHNRSGNSQHTFMGKGAVDLTCSFMPELIVLLRNSEFKRVCFYPKDNFVHADFVGDEEQYFIDKGDGWVKQLY